MQPPLFICYYFNMQFFPKKFLSTIKWREAAPFLIVSLLFLFATAYFAQKHLLTLYENQQSVTIKDRYGKEIVIKPNANGYYLKYAESIPDNFKKLLLRKEDRFFYYHLGINPASIIRAGLHYIFSGELPGSSTITQQLVKILLGNEQQRNLKNKIIETFYALALETHQSKNKILMMYVNSLHLGNQAQGFNEASQMYFGLPLEFLNKNQRLQLLATISSPSVLNPWKYKNIKVKKQNYSHQTQTSFELRTLNIDCEKDCRTTIDSELTEKLRRILERNISSSNVKGVENGAIVVIKVPENELLAIVGSPNPDALSNGYQINMAIEPRPIGSTDKPFIYLRAFEKGLRPYTTVLDREYKYSIATGFPLYPKNYDGLYRGEVTLHEALSNSLNVPTVKVLEYIGLTDFYDFLLRTLEFKPLMDLDNYQYGIALGGLEMDLLTLSHFLTIFPNEGMLYPLKIFSDKNGDKNYLATPMSGIKEDKKISEPKYVQLVNRILNDRKTGVNQFGLKSNLNLSQSNYGVKTGTSRDFHDSWTIGYTPDFVVGVWLGNSENTPMINTSGQSGAGKIWHETMEIMFDSPYNKNTKLNFERIYEFNANGNIEYGLRDDNYEKQKNLLQEKNLILNPHDKDLFKFEENMSIPLKARVEVEWFINNHYLATGENVIFQPNAPGQYEIEARDKAGEKEKVIIEIQQ